MYGVVSKESAALESLQTDFDCVSEGLTTWILEDSELQQKALALSLSIVLFESPGALSAYLQSMSENWNICPKEEDPDLIS
jgi:hypothetical protein